MRRRRRRGQRPLDRGGGCSRDDGGGARARGRGLLGGGSRGHGAFRRQPRRGGRSRKASFRGRPATERCARKLVQGLAILTGTSPQFRRVELALDAVVTGQRTETASVDRRGGMMMIGDLATRGESLLDVGNTAASARRRWRAVGTRGGCTRRIWVDGEMKSRGRRQSEESRRWGQRGRRNARHGIAIRPIPLIGWKRELPGGGGSGGGSSGGGRGRRGSDAR